MSTILKALRKLEQEKADQRGDASRHTAYLGPGSAAAGHYRSAGWWSKAKLRYAIAALLIVGLGGSTAYFYQMSRSSQPPGKTQASRQKSSAPPQRQASPTIGAVDTPARPERPSPSGGEGRRALGDDVPRPKTRPSRQMPAAAPSQGSNSKIIASQPKMPARRSRPDRPEPQWQSLKDLAKAPPAPPVQTPSPGPLPPKAAKRPDTGAADRESTARFSAEQAQPPVNTIQSTDASDQSVYSDVPLLTDGRLKVQALAWSPTAADRMAVINTRIVHEGDKVDGFTVVAIRSDDVVVREKGVTHRVEFGRP